MIWKRRWHILSGFNPVPVKIDLLKTERTIERKGLQIGGKNLQMGAFGSALKAFFHERSADCCAESFSAVSPVHMDIVQSEGIFLKNAQPAGDDFSFFADERFYSVTLLPDVRILLPFLFALRMYHKSVCLAFQNPRFSHKGIASLFELLIQS